MSRDFRDMDFFSCESCRAVLSEQPNLLGKGCRDFGHSLTGFCALGRGPIVDSQYLTCEIFLDVCGIPNAWWTNQKDPESDILAGEV